ncbi:MAG: J domain-containing protein, partial [Bdellovibrionota bacterium]
MKDWKYHCSVLGVGENASAKDVRRAYRRLALERHPDKHNNSAQATEDFQRLNESYNFLVDALANGRRSEPLIDQEAPTNPGFTAPAPRRAPPPAARISAPSNWAYWKIWLNGIALGCAVLTVSIWFEFAQDRSPAAVHDKRDLSAKAWCLIAKVGAPDAAHEVFEFWPEISCRNRCESIAAKKDVSCSWNGVAFRGPLPATPPVATATAAQPKEAGATCEISLERQAGQLETIPYQNQTESTCRTICLNKADSFPRAGIHCISAGIEFFQQPLYHPPPDIAPTAKEMHVIEPRHFDGMPRSTCYMTVVQPEHPFAQAYPDDLQADCESRCSQEIINHPLDRIVKCSYDGREIVNYTPDPLASYLAQHPGASGGQEGGSDIYTCEVYVDVAERRLSANITISDDKKCGSDCADTFRRAGRGAVVTC